MPRDDYDDVPDARAPFPAGVKVAGIVWIGYGVLALISAALNVVVGAAGAGAGGASPVCTGICVGLFGLAFLFVGVQSVRGTAKDVLGNGIGSIVFGVLYLAGAAFLLLMGGFADQAANQPGKGGAPINKEQFQTVAYVSGAIGGFFGLLLLLAGVLALSNRTAYKAWRRAEGLDRPRRRRDRDDYEDDRDRPRRRRDEDR
jgi:hypothetical protein